MLSNTNFNNKIFLQPSSAKEALHLYSLVEQAFLSYLCLLMIFLAVLAHLIFVNSNPAARLALRTIKRVS
jgi:hypothetical protein